MWSAINTFIPLLYGFGVFVLASRILGPKDFGTVALATGLSYVGTALCPGGFGEAIIQRLDITARHLDTVFWLCISSALLVYMVECLLAPWMAAFFNLPILAIFVPVISLRIIIDLAAVVPNALIAKSMSFHLSAIRSLISATIGGTVTVALLLLGYGLWALIVSQLLTSVVTVVAGFWTTKWRPRFTFSFADLGELAGYGLFSTASQNMTQVFAQNMQVLVGYFLGASQLGLYNFSTRVIAVFNNVVAGSLGAVAHPMFSGIQMDVDRVKRGFLMATFISSCISFPIFLGLASISDRLVPIIFGERWVSAVVLVKIQCALGLIACIGGLQAGLITSQGRANWWFYYQLLATIATIAIIIIFARYGLAIMMVAIAVKTYGFWFIPVRNCCTLLSMSIKEYLLNFRGPALGAASMGFLIYADRRLFIGVGNISGVLIDIVSGVIGYAAVICLFERKRIAALLHLIMRSRST
jgi:teichuronic acid exporter